jgi:hypothetical protein
MNTDPTPTRIGSGAAVTSPPVAAPRKPRAVRVMTAFYLPCNSGGGPGRPRFS